MLIYVFVLFHNVLLIFFSCVWNFSVPDTFFFFSYHLTASFLAVLVSLDAVNRHQWLTQPLFSVGRWELNLHGHHYYYFSAHCFILFGWKLHTIVNRVFNFLQWIVCNQPFHANIDFTFLNASGLTVLLVTCCCSNFSSIELHVPPRNSLYSHMYSRSSGTIEPARRVHRTLWYH